MRFKMLFAALTLGSFWFLGWRKSMQRRQASSGPGAGVISGSGEGEGKRPSPFNQGRRDVIEEASWESFPASDAPGW